jgi:CDP-diacylglycerol--glycerol-3-phosphate 3-phosphatidyltransferase
MKTAIEGITLATKVTILRILGVPVFVLLLVYYTMGLKAGENHDTMRVLALAVFVLVAATDALDGYLARSRNEVTQLGRVLDPLADKALLLSGLILLTRPSLAGLQPHIPIWFTTLVISRDAVLIGGFFLVHHFVGDVRVQPRWSGKIATVLQMGVIVWVLCQAAEAWFFHFVAAAGVFTGISFVQYVIDGARQLGRPAGH